MCRVSAHSKIWLKALLKQLSGFLAIVTNHQLWLAKSCSILAGLVQSKACYDVKQFGSSDCELMIVTERYVIY